VCRVEAVDVRKYVASTGCHSRLSTVIIRVNVSEINVIRLHVILVFAILCIWRFGEQVWCPCLLDHTIGKEIQAGEIISKTSYTSIT
jgi:hypothetical protein